MLPLSRLMLAFALSVLVLTGSPALAADEGQADLDKAMETNLNAKSFQDLGTVIQLCESALKKGLDEASTEIANSLLASTLARRGSVFAQAALQSPTTQPGWAKVREMALTDLEKSVKIRGQQPQALMYIAQLNLRPDGDADRAAEALGEAIKLTEEEPRLRAKALVLRAGTKKDFEQKIADLNEAVKLSPEDAEVVRARGLALADHGDSEKALADLDESIRLAPDVVAPHAAKAVVLAQLERYSEAIAALDEAQKLEPRLAPMMRMQKARIYAEQKKFDRALDELNAAHTLAPDNTDVLLLRATVHDAAEQPEKAMDDVKTAMQLKPGLPEGIRLRAMLLAKDKKVGEAIEELELLRNLNPTDTAVAMQLAMFHMAEKQNEKAIEVYGDLIADDAKNWQALRGRGDAYLNIGKHAEAIADYNKGLELEPKDHGILNNLAWVLATSPVDELRDGKRAVKLATEACEVTEYKMAHILSTLGAAYAETGDFESAIKWVKKGLEIAEETHIEPLGKELKSYEAGKPFRESLDEKPEEEEAPEEGEEE